MSDLFDRTLAALQLLQAPRTDPVSFAAWEEVREGLMAMRREHDAAQAVVQAARGLVTALNAFDTALDAGDPEHLVQLADACTAAERALVQVVAGGRADAEANTPMHTQVHH